MKWAIVLGLFTATTAWGADMPVVSITLPVCNMTKYISEKGPWCYLEERGAIQVYCEHLNYQLRGLVECWDYADGKMELAKQKNSEPHESTANDLLADKVIGVGGVPNECDERVDELETTIRVLIRMIEK